MGNCARRAGVVVTAALLVGGLSVRMAEAQRDHIYGAGGHFATTVNMPHHTYWGCFGPCYGPLHPHEHHHYWTCYGYCPGPLPPPHHFGGCWAPCPLPPVPTPPYYTCYGYCPYPLPPVVPPIVNVNYPAGDSVYPSIGPTYPAPKEPAAA